MGKIFTKKTSAILGFIAGGSFIIIFGEVNAGLSELIMDLLLGILFGCAWGFFVGKYILKKG